MEENDVTNTKQKILDRVLLREKRSNTSNQIDESQFKQRIKDKVEQLLKEKIYNWSPLNYNVYNSLLYLFSRSAPEYAVLTKIFSEITTRDVNFKPRSIFDFGSGVGTVTWYLSINRRLMLYTYSDILLGLLGSIGKIVYMKILMLIFLVI